jgi:Fungal pheromone mating factor STE2 GPCR
VLNLNLWLHRRLHWHAHDRVAHSHGPQKGSSIILNFLCLLILCVREIVFLANFLKIGSYGLGEAIFGAAAQIPRSDYVPENILAVLLSLTLYPCIFATLILQVRGVFAAEPRSQLIITIFLTIISVIIEAFWLTYETFALRNLFASPTAIREIKPYVYKTVQWTFIGLVSLCCLLFVYKLFVTIRRRRRMGFHSFGPLHILLIMFCQCLILPRTSSAIFRVF